MSLEELKCGFSEIFNDDLNVEQDRLDLISNGIKSIHLENFKAMDISYLEFNTAISNTPSTKVCGDDGMSSFMLLNCGMDFLKEKILFFFRYIFKYGVIPSTLNTSHIVPLIKDFSKPTNTIGNLRPISISNTLAQIFERLILIKSPQITQFHENQFGYKKNTSCSHALFTFKETVIQYLDKKQHCFAVSLDAVKAFDRIWSRVKSRCISRGNIRNY